MQLIRSFAVIGLSFGIGGNMRQRIPHLISRLGGIVWGKWRHMFVFRNDICRRERVFELTGGQSGSVEPVGGSGRIRQASHTTQIPSVLSFRYSRESFHKYSITFLDIRFTLRHE
ncbi:hypothetical protein CDAR_289391 [Caerostris darwini]|uniref:Secreted protein n=1 Tax=Caerostris darwini TaxID=1538125 RepID=A0AAV4PGS6_9ARAC|nr:hypothetical protein CDAR_289391 [Caerostris darwini]